MLCNSDSDTNNVPSQPCPSPAPKICLYPYMESAYELFAYL